jgi:hypothetical protein
MDPVAPESAALLAGLHDIRLPLEAAGGVFAELTAAAGLGLLLALLLAPLVRAATRPRAPPTAVGIAGRLAALDRLEGEERREALLRLVAELKPEVLRAMQPAIYRPGGLPTADNLEAALRGVDR